MKRNCMYLWWLSFCLLAGVAHGQQSPNTIKYKVAYDNKTQVYTVYVVPDYSVPNQNNSFSRERGGTAQVTLAVPTNFVIGAITDINGGWKSTGSLPRIGPGQPNQDWSAYKLNPNLNYYVIGKNPAETDYGPFVAGQPVPLFSFTGNGCFGPINAIAPNDPIIAAADKAYSLNVANSFYSMSGQAAGGNQAPLEQFKGVVEPAASCSSTVVSTTSPVSTTTQGANGTVATTNQTATTADISVTKQLIGNKVRLMGDIVTFETKVKNLGPDVATNVVVKDSLPTGLMFQSASITKGNGTFANPQLTLPTLNAGDSAILSVVAKVVQVGVSFNYARLISLDQVDPNPVNNSGQTCASVPVNLCSGRAVVASVPTYFTNVIWFKGGTSVALGNTVTFSEGGTYTFTASNATCPSEGCCPLVIVQSDCCPPTSCVPFLIAKTRRK